MISWILRQVRSQVAGELRARCHPQAHRPVRRDIPVQEQDGVLVWDEEMDAKGVEGEGGGGGERG